MNNKIIWNKIWGGWWSFLTCSYWGPQYIENFRFEGKSFASQVVFTFSPGNNHACYILAQDRKEYAQTLASAVRQNNALAQEWSQLLIKEVDSILDFLKNQTGEVNFETWQEFHQKMTAYYIPHVKIKYTVEGLNPKELETFLPIFEEARLHSEPVFKETEVFVRKVVRQMALKLSIREDLLLFLTCEKFDQLFLENSVSSELTVQLEEREPHAVLFFESAQNRKIFTGDEANEFEQSLTETEVQKDIKGTTGFPGKVTGKVKIVFDPAKADDFEEGDILVTGMTRPEFLSLVKKSAAFVTDSGGILSHAAIVARELKKPCVIGTQNATKMLKDGDVVEVDADAGTVKKISKK